MKFLKPWLLALSIAALALLAPATFANGGGGATFVEGVNYLSLPPLVVNYGGPGKIKYIKAEISIRVESAEFAKEVDHNMPLVRDTLIMFISGLTDENVSTGDAKEHMRQQALAKINEVLNAELGHAVAEAKKAEKEEHPKEEKEKDKKKSKKDKNDKGKAEKEEAKPAEAHHEPIVSDLLFDNLVVQK